MVVSGSVRVVDAVVLVVVVVEEVVVGGASVVGVFGGVVVEVEVGGGVRVRSESIQSSTVASMPASLPLQVPFFSAWPNAVRKAASVAARQSLRSNEPLASLTFLAKQTSRPAAFLAAARSFLAWHVPAVGTWAAIRTTHASTAASTVAVTWTGALLVGPCERTRELADRPRDARGGVVLGARRFP